MDCRGQERPGVYGGLLPFLSEPEEGGDESPVVTVLTIPGPGPVSTSLSYLQQLYSHHNPLYITNLSLWRRLIVNCVVSALIIACVENVVQ